MDPYRNSCLLPSILFFFHLILEKLCLFNIHRTYMGCKIKLKLLQILDSCIYSLYFTDQEVGTSVIYVYIIEMWTSFNKDLKQ